MLLSDGPHPCSHTPASCPSAINRVMQVNNLDLSPLHILNNAISDREFRPCLLCLVSSDKGHRPVRQTRSLVYREPGLRVGQYPNCPWLKDRRSQGSDRTPRLSLTHSARNERLPEADTALSYLILMNKTFPTSGK